MATVEIDELQLKNMERVRETLAKINSNPEGKRLLQKAQKLIDPNAITPDLDADDAKAKVDTEWQKKFEELQASIQADKEKRDNDAALAQANSKWEDGRKSLRDRGYTPEGIEAVEKQMQEKGIANHVIMANHLEKENPPQDVLTPRAFGSFNFVEQPKEDDDFLKSMLTSRGNDDNAVIKQAAEAINEIRHGRRR